jgi:hypothetical protein
MTEQVASPTAGSTGTPTATADLEGRPVTAAEFPSREPVELNTPLGELDPVRSPASSTPSWTASARAWR